MRAAAPLAPAAWQVAVEQDLRRREYRPSFQERDARGHPLDGGAVHFVNRARNLRAYLDRSGLRLEPREGAGWAGRLEVEGLSRGAARPERRAPAPPRVDGERAARAHAWGEEWYRNDERGIEQGFAIARPPLGLGPVRIVMKVSGLAPQEVEPQRVVFAAAGESVLEIRELAVRDSGGRALRSWMELDAGSLALVFVDEGALYPVVVDPLLTQAWSAEGDQSLARFGYSVASAGDVNGDGYSDVVVGSGAFDSGQAEEGKVFLYLGSATGLSPTPSWTAESDQVSALFGDSVATAGDVNGDGFSDLVVGARGFDNGQVDEGRASVFLGSAAGPAAVPDWTVENNQVGALLGAAVASAGDVNGDGFSDVLVGVSAYDNGDADEGAVLLFLGSAGGLAPSPVWTYEGGKPSLFVGTALAGAGDVDADGFSDVVIGVPFFESNGSQTDEGRALVFLGSATGLSAAPAWTVEGNRADAMFGSSVAAAGDSNGDGYADVIVGAQSYDNGEANEGAAFLYVGSASGLATAAAWTVEGNQAEAQLGRAVAGAGDVNGDGFADLVVGAPFYDGLSADEGQISVYLGSRTGPATVAAWSASGASGAALGYSVAAAGDVDADGFGDLVAGAIDFTGPGAYSQEGGAFLYRGSGSGPEAVAGWTAEPNRASSRFGVSVAHAGDVNGDGFADVIVGADNYDNGQSGEGWAFVYHGAAGGISTTPSWTAEGNGFGNAFGTAVSGAGDVNGDGYSDVIVGADKFTNGESQEGRAFVYLGSPGGLATSPSWSVESNQLNAQLGYAVAGAGDVNGDGYSDVIVGARYFDAAATDEGRAWIYLGSSTGLSSTAAWVVSGAQASAMFGSGVGSAGDVNGDGYSDVIVGAPNYDGPELNEGRAYVYLGSASGPSTTPSWTMETNQTNASFGFGVASAGDVNGDGYSDVLVGASAVERAYLFVGSASGLSTTPAWSPVHPAGGAVYGARLASAGDVNGDGFSDVLVAAYGFDGTETNEGKVYLYLGSAAGLPATADWSAEGNQLSAWFGIGTASAGDVNGDGYSDVIVGAMGYDSGEADEGKAFLYYGNAGSGFAVQPRQARGDGSAPVQLLGSSGSDSQARLRALGRSHTGRARVKLVWEAKPLRTSFDRAGLGRSASWADTGLVGVQLDELLSGLSGGTRYHWRARLVAFPNIYGRWFSVGPNGWSETDFRTAGGVVGLPLGATCAAPGECASGWCADAVCCDRACSGACEACSLAAGAAVSGACGYLPATVVCRAAAGNCDVEERCTGFGSGCPTEVFQSGTTCRAAAGDCDAAELCGGSSAHCAADTFQSGTTCRASAGDCDAAELCSGSAAHCAADAFLSGTTCRASAGNCDAEELCSGSSAHCGPDTFQSGTMCRASAGDCDVAELCSGSSAHCGLDIFQSGTTCRASAGDCDATEVCGGTSPHCPSDAFQTGTTCRASMGDCDAPELCPGASADCPPDALLAGTVCRAASDVCDQAEACTGASAACPDDWFAGPGVECRAPAGACDAAEFCSGLSGACADDGRIAAGIECRAASGVCDLAEQCDGAAPTCPPDLFAPSTIECRASAGVCDLAESCTGGAADCPSDAFAPATLVCRAAQDSCDLAESCSGSSAPCPADARSSLSIVEDALARAVVGRPYPYNAAGRVATAAAAPGTTFSDCTAAAPLTAGFRVEPVTGAVRWVPTAQGTAVLCVRADDGCTSDEYSFQVAVGDGAGEQPVAAFDFEPLAPVAGEAVRFDASRSAAAPGATLVAYEWTFGDGSRARGSVATHAFGWARAYGVHLTVYDSQGRSAETARSVPVGDAQCANPPGVIARAEPATGAEPLEVRFTSETSGARAVAWDFGDGSRSSEANPTHTFAAGGYSVRLIGVDDAGCMGMDVVRVAVGRGALLPPMCAAFVEPSAGSPPLTARFSGEAEDPNAGGGIRAAGWSFDDGFSTAEPAVTRTYEAPAVRLARFSAEAVSGLTCADEAEVVVRSESGITPPRIRTVPGLTATCFQPFSYAPGLDRPIASGSPVRWRLVDEAPGGMTLDAQTGVLSWTPGGYEGAERVVIEARNEAGADVQDFEVRVYCPTMAFATSCGCGSAAGEPLLLLAGLAALGLGRRRLTRARPGADREARLRR